MKPFNVERALAGDPVVTRNGRHAEQIINFKTEVKCGQYTLYGVVDGYIHNWTLDGRRESDTKESPFDLFMASVKREGWIIVRSPDENGIRKTSDMYPSPDVLYANNPELINCWLRKVEWEE